MWVLFSLGPTLPSRCQLALRRSRLTSARSSGIASASEVISFTKAVVETIHFFLAIDSRIELWLARHPFKDSVAPVTVKDERGTKSNLFTNPFPNFFEGVSSSQEPFPWTRSSRLPLLTAPARK
jgi:hypothetical protein